MDFFEQYPNKLNLNFQLWFLSQSLKLTMENF